jgi:hypothetical protein
MMRPIAVIFALTAGMTNAADLPVSESAYVATRSLPSAHATQAAAADAKYIYAISSKDVAKLDRASGKELAVSTGEAKHLNSGFVWEGKLLCAHSNFPKKPDQSDIRVLDPESMKLTIFHTFENPPGSLTWVVRRGEHWWCHFAHYGADKEKSVLVRFDEKWQESGRWTYAKNLVDDWGSYSLSGGIWLGDELLATGHDKKLLYRLRLPKDGTVIECIETVRSPFPGQGIALDTETNELIGIERAKGILFARFEAKK